MVLVQLPSQRNGVHRIHGAGACEVRLRSGDTFALGAAPLGAPSGFRPLRCGCGPLRAPSICDFESAGLGCRLAVRRCGELFDLGKAPLGVDFVCLRSLGPGVARFPGLSATIQSDSGAPNVVFGPWTRSTRWGLVKCPLQGLHSAAPVSFRRLWMEGFCTSAWSRPPNIALAC